LLQKLRDSVNVARYHKYLEDIETYSRNIGDKLYNLYSGFLNNVFITYHRHGYLPASIMYWIVMTLNPESNAYLLESNALTYHVLPYREGYRVVFYSSNPYSSTTINLLQTASLTGNEPLLITPKPLDERITSMYSRYTTIYIDKTDELEAVLVMVLSTYYALSKIFRDKLGSRGRRLYDHVVEGVLPIVEDLIDRYVDTLINILNQKEFTITSSKVLEPISLYFVDVFRRLGYETYYQPIDQAVGGRNILLLSTSVDDYSLREYRFRFNMSSTNCIELSLNTDPLEAQVYLSLLGYYLIYSLSGIH